MTEHDLAVHPDAPAPDAPAPDAPAGHDARRAGDLCDAELVAAMRREDPEAIAELYRRFAPLLRNRARGWLGSGAACEELVADVLADVLLSLMRPAASTPRSLAAYLLVALRHRLYAERREATRRREAELGAAAHDRSRAHATARPARVAEGLHLVAPAGVSAHALRAAAGVDAHEAYDAPLHPVLARLVAQLDAGLREHDRLLLAWLADHVPMRTVAGWLGIGYDAALKRASRLRARLRRETLAHADLLPPGERQVVHAFLGRASHEDGSAPSTPETGP